LSVRVAKDDSPNDGVDGDEVFGVNHGDDLDGCMSEDELRSLLPAWITVGEK
jgi:hypothetical protein